MTSLPQRDGLTGAVDVLSPLSHELLNLGGAATYDRLVVHGPGNAQARDLLARVKPRDLLSVPITSAENASAMLSGLWLWHDWLDESHTISQALESSTGSYWHAIMHRREGDFSNAKYWNARVGRHEIYPALGITATQVLNGMPADKSLLRVLRGGWDPDAFVDLVREVSRDADDPRLPAVQAIAKIEWRMLFDHCTRGATG